MAVACRLGGGFVCVAPGLHEAGVRAHQQRARQPRCRDDGPRNILLYLMYSGVAGTWSERLSVPGVAWSVATGVCVGAGTVVFFMLFQRGGPLSLVPAVLAVGAALMAIVGMVMFREPPSVGRVVGVLLSVAGLYLLRK